MKCENEIESCSGMGLSLHCSLATWHFSMKINGTAQQATIISREEFVYWLPVRVFYSGYRLCPRNKIKQQSMKTISTSNRWDLIALYVNFVLCSNNTYLFNKHFYIRCSRKIFHIQCNEWMGRTSKQRKWPSLYNMWWCGYVCLTCYCCSRLVFLLPA